MIRIIGNILWWIFGGLITALAWCIGGLVLCITVVGIPFGVQCFKFAKLTFVPFGKKVKLNFSEHPIANIIWLVLLGWETVLVYFVAACLCFITIVGIPKGIQVLKFSKLAIAPFGAKIK